ncbi:hypothetical protein F5J12DRAFT_895472 [Pisolithus orientalis]|uniref:uncharacterized protein n=1 Tax=Pisolithus orientalis TaxID=936130 RepID=UPI0022251570|nr:uncharacterized protein F5J12DRAFT_895472 [Pisolithus orientalis]KAI5998535.1 hypothetical protein F5J12DRAFT_895472 [Pisolithus orientalis]
MPDRIIITFEPERPGHYGGPATLFVIPRYSTRGALMPWYTSLPSSSAIASAFPPQAPGANAIHPDDIILPEPVVYASNDGTMFGVTNIQLHPHEREVLLHSDNVNQYVIRIRPRNVPEPEVPLNQAPDSGPINNVPDISDNETTYHSPDMRPQHDGNNQ